MTTANNPREERDSFFAEDNRICSIDGGSFGGKAQGLVSINKVLKDQFPQEEYPEFPVSIPSMYVLCTDMFDKFMAKNDLYSLAYSDASDQRIGHAFQQGDLPFEALGPLRELINQSRNPLAVRSSSLLEDREQEPFAGVYATKIIPNSQFDAQLRFRRLTQAIKYVYASLYFREARDYLKVTGHELEEEKMAVIVQKVHGGKHGTLFYPEISGVARSYNFYPMERVKHEDGVVHLALGLGKTIVDGGISWSYSPVRPQVKPPYRTVDELLKITQTRFWAVNLGEPARYDPLQETEYLIYEDLTRAEEHGTLKYLASTFDPYANRLTIGTAGKGPRVLTFGRILELEEIPLNDIVKKLLALCEQVLGAPVEIEFAVTLDPLRFGFLQVRPMTVMKEIIHVEDQELSRPDNLLASREVLGNGIDHSLKDIIYVRPENFQTKDTQAIARELARFNRGLVEEGKSYLLIVFGRLGTTDPWLGIPIQWGDVSGARAVVETTREDFNVVLSQGSHYFHNLTSLGVYYFSLPADSDHRIDWQWLEKQNLVNETDLLRHIRLSDPLKIKVDGRKGAGLIQKP